MLRLSHVSPAGPLTKALDVEIKEDREEKKIKSGEKAGTPLRSHSRPLASRTSFLPIPGTPPQGQSQVEESARALAEARSNSVLGGRSSNRTSTTKISPNLSDISEMDKPDLAVSIDIPMGRNSPTRSEQSGTSPGRTRSRTASKGGKLVGGPHVSKAAIKALGDRHSDGAAVEVIAAAQQNVLLAYRNKAVEALPGKGYVWEFKTFVLFPYLIKLGQLDFIFRALFPIVYLGYVLFAFSEVSFGADTYALLGLAPCYTGA